MNQIIINQLSNSLRPAIATIGNFDGVHLGHQQLFIALTHEAKLHDYRRIVITFEPLPHEYFCDDKDKQRLARLSLLRDKFSILQKLDFADELVVLHFNSSIANLTPKLFIRQVLQQRLGVRHVVIGHDFKFGKYGKGTLADFDEYGVKATVIPPFKQDNQRISSSIIRDYAKNNELAMIRYCLGRNLQYTARIIHGNKMGRKFGVPTINLAIGRNRLALWGIYVAKVYIEDVVYNAVVSIGKNPTTNDLDVYKLEAHLLDVDLDLYGKIATVEILHFLRNESKFNNLDDLFKQIRQDLNDARAYFINN